MPKVSNSGRVTQAKLTKLIDEINLFVYQARNDLRVAAQYSKIPDRYDAPIDLLKVAFDAAALQPKTHSLLGLHLMVMTVNQGERNAEAKGINDALIWAIGDFIVKLMTDVKG